jgi:putative radical SAM enzyme (TIGR03279 family)
MAGHLISCVQEGSIAADLGLDTGDSMLLLDGRPIGDIFDFRLRELSGKLLLTVRKAAGELIEFDIEKDEDEELGLEFAEPMLRPCAACANHCVFCFIDQLPEGLRPSLYYKDDDYRLSFLNGNYVTLTNLDEDGLKQLIESRLSPVNVSVHTIDPDLRRKMLRHKKAGDICRQLEMITAAGLTVNAQIVLCPGINDGLFLHDTIAGLVRLGEPLQSIAVVPVGLTRYRGLNHLLELEAVTLEDARAALQEIHGWQRKMLEERKTRLVYAADELYLKAGWPFPPVSEYEDLPQLENGVGMAPLFLSELAAGLKECPAVIPPLMTAWPDGAEDSPRADPKEVLLVTGDAAAPLMRPFTAALSAWSGLTVSLVQIKNGFFGEQVTVAGLLTGQDLVAQLPELLKTKGAPPDGEIRIILPASMIKLDEGLTLDGFTLQRLADELGTAVHVCAADAPGLLGVLAWLGGFNAKEATA